MLQSEIMLELHIPDFGKAKDFYCSIGFDVVWERPSNKKERGYMVMRKGDCILNFYGGDNTVSEHAFFSQFPKDTPKGYGVEIIIPVDGIEHLYKDFCTKHQERIVKELNQKYEKQDFRATDPFGYYLRFVERYDWVNGRDEQGNRLIG